MQPNPLTAIYFRTIGNLADQLSPDTQDGETDAEQIPSTNKDPTQYGALQNQV